MKSYLVVLACLVLATLASCSRQPTGPVGKVSRIEVRDNGGGGVISDHPLNRHNSVGTEGSLMAAVRNGRLYVNDQDYGPLSDGDQVLVEPGRVTINGKERIPLGNK